MEQKRTYLITGGAGFIGTNVARALVADGHNVVVVDTLVAGDASRLPDGTALHTIDIRDTDALRRVLRGVDVVLHLAALPSVQGSIDDPVESHAVNVTGTLSVLEACRAASVPRVVFASSSAVYGDQDALPLPETLPLLPKSPYALHKQIGEAYLALSHRMYGLHTVSLRFFNVYGPCMNPDGAYALVIGQFLKRRAAGEPLAVTGTGAQTRDFVHVADVVRALTLAADGAAEPGTCVNIGTGIETSINDLAALVGGPVTHVAARLEPGRTCADVARAKKLLGWSPEVSIEEGIRALKKDFGIA